MSIITYPLPDILPAFHTLICSMLPTAATLPEEVNPPPPFFFPRDSPHYRLTQCKSLPTQSALLTLSAARHKQGEGRGRKGERKDASGSGSGKELHFSSGSEKVSGKKIWKSLWQQTCSLKYIKG